MRNKIRIKSLRINDHKKGKVYLVGAGPGDTGLLTLKGKEAIEEGDCIIYDHLVAEEILSFAREDAEKIYVGKKGEVIPSLKKRSIAL